jgi:peptide/nickel transport system substrate-binding protein
VPRVSYSQEVSDDQSTSTYTFVLEKRDHLQRRRTCYGKGTCCFNIYVLCDPLYDGSATFYSMDVQGLSEYRLQTSAETLPLPTPSRGRRHIHRRRRNPAYPAADGATAEQQAAFWAYLDPAGEKFAQEIVNYVMNNYLSDDYCAELFLGRPHRRADQGQRFPDVAYGMGMWGYGTYATVCLPMRSATPMTRRPA